MSVSWFVNIDAHKAGDPHWLAYKAADADKIEKAYQKKSKSCMLNETYKIDFSSLKQIRRDDADRWRFIKRGGSASDGPPGANGFVAADGSDAEDDAAKDADEEEEAPAPKKKGGKAAAAKPAAKGKAKKKGDDDDEEPAPPAAAAWTVPATDSPFKKGAAGVAPTPRDPVPKKDDAAAMSDDESVPDGKPRSGGAAAASKPAAAAASSSNGAEEKRLRSELDSIRKQMTDLEAELESAQAAAEAAQKKLAAEVARLTASAAESKKAAEEGKKVAEEAESLRTKNAALTKRATKAEGELSAAQDAAKNAQASCDELSKKLTAATKAQQAAETRASTAESTAALHAGAAADLAALRNQYASVLTAIKPVAATFGMAPTTVIGAAIVEWENNGGRIKVTARKTIPAAAAAAVAATPAKKRARDEEEDQEDEENAATQEIVSTAKKTRPAAATSAASAAAPRADMHDDERHSEAPSDDEGAASPRAGAAAASRNIDDDATQPMVAPNSDDEGMTDAKGSAAAPASAGKFLHNPNALESSLISKVGDKTVPLCVAAVPAASTSGPHLVMVGGRNGSLQLFEMAPSVPARLLPLTMVHRPAHKFAPKESPKAGEDGEQYALTSHVLAMAVVPLKAAGSYMLFTGEGRLLRAYSLTISGAAGKLALVSEFDVGASSWITCLTRLFAPPSARQANQEHVGVGVSGAAQVVQVYSIATGGAAAVVKLERSMPTRSDEVRALCQLRRDGRLVVAGCSAALEGSMNEGGSIELHAWDGAAKSRQFLTRDLQVHPSIGLRCNSIQVLHGTGPAGADQLLAAYEYCNNGARQLVQYTLDTAARGLDVSAVNVEAKNNPPLDENTFTSLAVSQAHPNRCVAMTYGGKCIVYELNGDKNNTKLATFAAHGDSDHDDGTHCFIVSSRPDNSAPVLLTVGGINQLKQFSDRK